MGEAGEETRPGEAGAGIGLASRRDVAVRGDVAQRQRLAQAPHELLERSVLRLVEGAVVGAFELDADREVVAARCGRARTRPRRATRA